MAHAEFTDAESRAIGASIAQLSYLGAFDFRLNLLTVSVLDLDLWVASVGNTSGEVVEACGALGPVLAAQRLVEAYERSIRGTR